MTLTVIMKSSDVDVNPAPSGDRDHSRFSSLISDDEGGVFSTVLGNSGHLRRRQRPSITVPKLARRELTDGNILRVSYKVLCQ